MTNLKKKINKIKTETFLNQFPILVLLQHNNLSVNEWSNFKQNIQQKSQISNNKFKNGDKLNQSVKSFQILNIKNSLLKKIVLTHHSLGNSVSLETLCQGPNFLVGCSNSDQLKSLWNFLDSNSKCIFISCFYKNQLLNHLDVESLLKTNPLIYQTLLSSLDKKTDLHYTLQSKLELHPLLTLQSNLMLTLEALKQSKI